MRYLIISILLSYPIVYGQEDGFRNWTSNDGKKIQGKIVRFEEKEDGDTGEMTQVAVMDMKIAAGNEKKGEKAEVKRFNVPLERFDPDDREDILDWDWAKKREPFWARSMSLALGEPRDVQKQRREDGGIFDRILFRDSAVAKGIIQNPSFQIRTPYGAVTLSSQVVAAVQFGEDGVSMDQFITVNNNRFSGIVSLPADPAGGEPNRLTYQTDSGATESLRKEMVAKVIFRVREGELDPIDERRKEGEGAAFFRLKNGDYFDAKVSGGQFSMNSLGRHIRVPVTDVQRVEAAGSGRPQTTIFKSNGGKETGFFSPDDLSLELEVGPVVPVFRNRLDAVYCQEGFRPLGKIVHAPTDKEARLTIKADEGGQPFGVLSRISSSSPFEGILQQGDRVVVVNGQVPDFESRDDSYELAQEALYEEQSIPYITLGIQRGESFFHVTVLGAENAPSD